MSFIRARWKSFTFLFDDDDDDDSTSSFVRVGNVINAIDGGEGGTGSGGSGSDRFNFFDVGAPHAGGATNDGTATTSKRSNKSRFVDEGDMIRRPQRGAFGVVGISSYGL